MRYLDTLQYNETFEPVHGYEFYDQYHRVFVPADELFAYRQGELIQHAMPSVSPEDRDWLLMGRPFSA
jgi:hypothetical protein